MPFNPISLKPNLVLPSHLCLHHPSGLLPAGLTFSILYSIFFFPACATLPTLLTLKFCYLGEEHKTWSSSLWNFSCLMLLPPYQVHISIPAPYFHTLQLMFFLNISDQVSHPYKIQGKLIIPHILIFTLLDSKWKEKDSGLNDSRHSLNLIC